MPNIADVGMTIMLRAVDKFYSRPKFGRFLELEETKNKIRQAAKRKEKQFPDLLVSYVSAAFFIPKFILDRVRWDLLFGLFGIIASHSKPTSDIPLLKPHATKDKKDTWDYDGREHAMYVHIIARAYGWSKKTIDNLDIDDALKLIQEIIVDEQLDREFLWSMSDRSYIYNYKTKSGKPNPLERPYFMKEETKAPEKMLIPKSMMPMGNVSYATLSTDYHPKEIKHQSNMEGL